MSATTISSTTLKANQIFTPLVNVSTINASNLFVKFGSEFDGAMIIRNNLEVDNTLTAGDIISTGLMSGSNISMTGQVTSSVLKANNRVNAPTMNASVLNGSSLNVSGSVTLQGQVNAYAVSITELLEAGDIVSNGNSSLTNISASTIHSTNISGVNGSFTYLTADNLQETLIAGPGIAIVDRTISTQQILVAGNNLQIIDETISTTSLLNISNVSSEKGKIVNLSCTNLSATSITADNVQPTLTVGSNLTLVGTLINTSSNLNISNVSAVSGFIETFEADTIQTIGLNSQGIVAEEADIETVRAIDVDTNTLTCLTGTITNLSSTNISGARGTITNFSSTNSSATRGTITNISCSNISCSLKINVLNVSGTNATFTNLTAPNVQPTLTAGTNITIVGTTISSSATLVAGTNIDITSGVIKTTSNVNLSNLSTDVLHSPVIVSDIITSIDGEIDILNADISVTTPFLAATNISSTNGTFTSLTTTNLNVSQLSTHNICAVNEIQASIVNASTIIAGDAFSVLSSTLSTSFYTDFVDDQKFVLKVTGVGSPSAPKLAFRTGTADALLITQSSNVSIANHLTVTNTSGTNASFTNLTADNVQPLLTAGSGVSIVNNVISAGTSAITAGLNISILNDVVSTTTNFSVSTLYVTGDSTVGPILNIGLNDNSTTPKTIYFGGLTGDNSYDMAVIENRIYSGSESSELLLFKGNDVNTDRIRLRAGLIQFDTYTGATTNRTAENIRMTITSAGEVGIGIVPTEPLHVIGNILNTGNIQNNKFKVTQAVTRLGNLYGGGNGEITIANNVGCSGGTLIFYITCGGFATSGGLYSYIIRYKNAQGVTRATITAPFYFNQTSVHQAWGITQRFTGIPAANMLISIERSSTNLRMDNNDFVTIVMEELPY
jgi:hypothetical protein